MNNRYLPVHPLQALITQASRNLPAQTGVVARIEARLHNTSGASLILADVSGSMSAPAWAGQRKIDVLRDAVDPLMRGGEHRLIAFSGAAREVTRVPAPDGGTALHLAIQLAQSLRPRYTLVISDGQPDDPVTALGEAKRLSGTLDVLYVGPDTDSAAIEFMQRLAQAGAGSYTNCDLRRIGRQPQALANTLAKMLPGPMR